MTNKPNFVSILTDDLGHDDISALNPKSEIKTSAIDSVAQYQKDMSTNELIHWADMRLYDAKRNGKGRIAFATTGGV